MRGPRRPREAKAFVADRSGIEARSAAHGGQSLRAFATDGSAAQGVIHGQPRRLGVTWARGAGCDSLQKHLSGKKPVEGRDYGG